MPSINVLVVVVVVVVVLVVVVATTVSATNPCSHYQIGTGDSAGDRIAIKAFSSNRCFVRITPTTTTTAHNVSSSGSVCSSSISGARLVTTLYTAELDQLSIDLALGSGFWFGWERNGSPWYFVNTMTNVPWVPPYQPDDIWSQNGFGGFLRSGKCLRVLKEGVAHTFQRARRVADCDCDCDSSGKAHAWSECPLFILCEAPLNSGGTIPADAQSQPPASPPFPLPPYAIVKDKTAAELGIAVTTSTTTTVTTSIATTTSDSGSSSSGSPGAGSGSNGSGGSGGSDGGGGTNVVIVDSSTDNGDGGGSSGGDSNNIVFIILGAAGGVVLLLAVLLILLVVVAFIHRRRRRKGRSSTTTTATTTTSTKDNTATGERTYGSVRMEAAAPYSDAASSISQYGRPPQSDAYEATDTVLYDRASGNNNYTTTPTTATSYAMPTELLEAGHSQQQYDNVNASLQ